jgi:lipopolysaccharide transport system ATP-binding protein
MNDVVISVRNLSKQYNIFKTQRSRLLHMIKPSLVTTPDKVQALSHVHFEIRRGEAVALIGRNGGGKSTLLEILTGTLQPTDGEVIVKGRVSALLELGSGFNPNYTGRDNVILNGLILGLSRKEIMSRFHEIEAFAEIGTAIDRPVKTYSSGMMMRLAFAVQVLCSPDILIVDEALSVGDFFFQQKCLSFIRKLREDGVTLLFVSHDMGVVRDLCSRVLYLQKGKLAFDGAVAEGVSLFFREHDIAFDPARLDNIAKIAPSNTDALAILEVVKQDAIWVRDPALELQPGVVLAVAVYDEDGGVTTNFRMGTPIRISVAYTHHSAYENHVGFEFMNKHGMMASSFGSMQLSIQTHLSPSHGDIVFFDLWVHMMLEAGYYSLNIGLGYATGPNIGEYLDRVLNLGPIHLTWDYHLHRAPFFGACGLPIRGAYREVAPPKVLEQDI